MDGSALRGSLSRAETRGAPKMTHPRRQGGRLALLRHPIPLPVDRSVLRPDGLIAQAAAFNLGRRARTPIEARDAPLQARVLAGSVSDAFGARAARAADAAGIAVAETI